MLISFLITNELLDKGLILLLQNCEGIVRVGLVERDALFTQIAGIRSDDFGGESVPRIIAFLWFIPC